MVLVVGVLAWMKTALLAGVAPHIWQGNSTPEERVFPDTIKGARENWWKIHGILSFFSNIVFPP